MNGVASRYREEETEKAPSSETSLGLSTSWCGGGGGGGWEYVKILRYKRLSSVSMHYHSAILRHPSAPSAQLLTSVACQGRHWRV